MKLFILQETFHERRDGAFANFHERAFGTQFDLSVGITQAGDQNRSCRFGGRSDFTERTNRIPT